MNRILLLPLFLLLACSGPVPSTAGQERIAVGYGPEDLLRDPLTEEPSLLISCSSRRDSYPEYGEIRRYYPERDSLQTMVRTGEPLHLRFHPHGIYLDTLSKPERLLVVSHENEESAFHPILIYTVGKDSLYFKEMIESPLLVSPNTVVTGPSGEVYVVNDSHKRGSILEKALKLKRANIVRFVHYEDSGYSGEVLADKLGMPAGMNRIGKRLFVSDATANKVFAYDITNDGLENRTVVAKVTGPDNIRIYKGQLLVACHTRPFAFIRHVKSPENLSPCEIILLDPENGAYRTLFSDDGSVISAGSVACCLGGDLFIGQVFEDYILRLPCESGN